MSDPPVGPNPGVTTAGAPTCRVGGATVLCAQAGFSSVFESAFVAATAILAMHGKQLAEAWLDNADVTIRGSDDFRKEVINDLSVIATTQAGREVMASLVEQDKSLVILDPASVNFREWKVVARFDKFGSVCTHEEDGDAVWRLDQKDNYVPGPGTGSTIVYDPTHDNICDGTSPSDVILFHEMDHADRAARGVNTSKIPAQHNGFGTDEEEHVIVHENRYRSQRKLPRRQSHSCL